MSKSTKKSSSTKVKPTIKTEKKEKVSLKPFKVSEKAYDVVIPDGFSFETHKPLKKSNFESEYLYLQHRAAHKRYQAEEFDKKAEEAKKYGSSADRRKKKQLVKLQSRMAELKKELEGHNIDVEKLLADAAKEAKEREESTSK